MDHAAGTVKLDNLTKSVEVADVTMFERSPFDRVTMTINEVIVAYRQITALSKFLAYVTADISGAADNENDGTIRSHCIPFRVER
jgi:hypothetical protein